MRRTALICSFLIQRIYLLTRPNDFCLSAQAWLHVVQEQPKLNEQTKKRKKPVEPNYSSKVVTVLPTGIFLCQIFTIWHFFEVVGINIFGLAYLSNLAYFSTIKFFDTGYAKCWPNFLRISNFFVIGNTHETRHSVLCALFSPQMANRVLPRICKH